MQFGQLERILLEDDLWSLYLVTPSSITNELPKLGDGRNPAWTKVNCQHEQSLNTNRYYLLHRDRIPTIYSVTTSQTSDAPKGLACEGSLLIRRNLASVASVLIATLIDVV